MKIRITVKFIIAFLALTFVMHEAHEIVHTSVGRLICGEWGLRDFNVWGLCEGCSEQHPIAIIATFAGPIFTFIMMWIGAILLKKDSLQQKSLGFALVFANLPFARILTAAFGGGDEVYGLNILLDNHSLAWTIGLSAIVLITIIPLYRAYSILKNKRSVLWFLGFFILPTFIDLLLVLGLMNNLLAGGVLSDYWILGSPIIVTVWTVFVTLIFLLTKNHIYSLGEQFPEDSSIA